MSGGWHHGTVDRDLRDCLRSLAVIHPRGPDERARAETLSDDAAEYLARIASDGTLKAALAEIGASEPDLAG